MIFLTKQIFKIYLLDFFTEVERNSSNNKITQQLDKFLSDNNIPVQSLFSNSKEEFLQNLNSISEGNNGEGVIMHFIGHGDVTKVGFGNNSWYVKWTEIKSLLIDINTKCTDGLIVNTSIMCYGKNIFQLTEEVYRSFFAGIGSLTKKSSQALNHNMELYKKCFTKDRAEMWLKTINDNLEISQGQKAYLLKYT